MPTSAVSSHKIPFSIWKTYPGSRSSGKKTPDPGSGSATFTTAHRKKYNGNFYTGHRDMGSVIRIITGKDISSDERAYPVLKNQSLLCVILVFHFVQCCPVGGVRHLGAHLPIFLFLLVMTLPDVSTTFPPSCRISWFKASSTSTTGKKN